MVKDTEIDIDKIIISHLLEVITDDDLKKDLISYINNIEEMERLGEEIIISLKTQNSMAKSVIDSIKEQGEPYPPPSRLIKENCIYEIKQCCHCEHSNKPPNIGRASQWQCNHPKLLNLRVSLVNGDTHTSTDCEDARASGFLGFGRGKCGPEAKYYEVRKFKENPILPKEKQL